MALPRAGGGYERCWQSKYFCGPINWTKSDKSLASALENWPGISEGCLVELLVQRVVGLAAQHC
jgi:hypothetical protein